MNAPMREPIEGPAQSGRSGVRALLEHADAVVDAAQDFQGWAEPLAPDGISKQAELERAVSEYRRVRSRLD
jgi:hypothetical protein